MVSLLGGAMASRVPPAAPQARGVGDGREPPPGGSVERGRQRTVAGARRQIVGAFVRQLLQVEAADDQGGEGQDREEGFQGALP